MGTKMKTLYVLNPCSRITYEAKIVSELIDEDGVKVFLCILDGKHMLFDHRDIIDELEFKKLNQKQEIKDKIAELQKQLEQLK